MSKILFIVNHDVVIYNFRLELVEELILLGMKFIYHLLMENELTIW